MAATNSFGAKAPIEAGGRSYEMYRLDALADRFDVDRLPYSLKVLLENLLRTEDGVTVTAADVEALASWDPAAEPDAEIAFTPARVLMQDFTGVPAVVDLAAMREAMVALGGDPAKINPLVPAELVIDHSIQVDSYGTDNAFELNAALEFDRNRERYEFLRWGQTAFDNFKVVPPNTGICHQVNLEYLSRVVFTSPDGLAYPDTLVGTDSHTPMVNGLGIVGWGVGGIEAEAAMLGQPISMLIPQVVGVKLKGRLPEGSTATDLVLTVTEMLRKVGVVGKFVEFYGEGVANVPVENRATIGNMSPEYGSTITIFPIDDETLRYLRFTGRSAEQVALTEAYAKVQGMWHDPGREPVFSQTLELDLADVVPSLAGPTRPQDRVRLDQAKEAFREAVVRFVPNNGGGDEPAPGTHEAADAASFPASDPPADVRPGDAQGSPDPDAGGGPSHPNGRSRPRRPVPVTLDDGSSFELDHGHVVIAAITSCTNTSNPSVMLAAGLLAKKAVEAGLATKPWVKTSLAPGSKVVMEYYERAGLLAYLEKLRFNLVGFGCTTCIGNSGPLRPEISRAVNDADLAAVSVLSGNRNFEGRINPDCKMNYLASPPLVVAYALAGSMDVDLYDEPLGEGTHGPVYLRDIWPSASEVAQVVAEAVRSEMFSDSYGSVFAGDAKWNAIDIPTGDRFAWTDTSTYVRKPPFFDGMGATPAALTDIHGARVLAKLGDSVTTDHISPAGSIRADGPAGQWLVDHGVEKADFNSYGARRGNHEVMIRGTFGNIRLRNQLAPGTEGGYTTKPPGSDAVTTIYEAAVAYQAEGTPLVVLAGKEYGSGSSRDWAAKGTALLGIRAVLAESYERIHRSNLIGMGVLPLQFRDGDSVASLGLTGEESFDITGLEGLGDDAPLPRELAVTTDGGRSFPVRLRIDTPKEAEYYRHGGILQYVLRQLNRPER